MFTMAIRLYRMKEVYLAALLYAGSLAGYLFFLARDNGTSNLSMAISLVSVNIFIFGMAKIHAGLYNAIYCIEHGDSETDFWTYFREGAQLFGIRIVLAYYIYFGVNWSIGHITQYLHETGVAIVPHLLHLCGNSLNSLWLVVGTALIVGRDINPAQSFGAMVRFVTGNFKYAVLLSGLYVLLMFVYFYSFIMSFEGLMNFIAGSWLLPAALALTIPITAYIWGVGAVATMLFYIDHEEEEFLPEPEM